MLFNILKNRSEKAIDESISKYKKYLHEDLDLKICIAYNKKFYFPEIEVFNDREIVIKLVAENKEKLKYKIDQVLKVDFLSKTGLYSTRIKIINMNINESSRYYRCKIIDPIEKNQRRGYYRLPINIDISFKLLPNKFKSFNGIAKDISVGGMLLESTQYIPEDRNIKLFFEVNKKRYILKGTIIKSRDDEKNQKYLHHIRFDDLDFKQKNELSKFIFNEQKKKLRRRSGTV